jgi:hypothetical protein
MIIISSLNDLLVLALSAQVGPYFVLENAKRTGLVAGYNSVLQFGPTCSPGRKIDATFAQERQPKAPRLPVKLGRHV